MTPKTAYQKMRDNRVRRENMLLEVDCFEPLPDSQLSGVRFKPESLGSSVTLEDGSVLRASPPFDLDLSLAIYEASKRGELRHGLFWTKKNGVWVHSDMRFPDET